MSVAFDAGLKLPEAWLRGGLVDPVSGIISGVWEQPRHAGYADLFQYAAMTCDTGAFGGPDNFRHVGGASLDRGAAWIKAVGEGIERYCSAIYDPEDFLLAPRRIAPFDTVDPALLALYPDDLTADPRFAFRRFDDSTPVRWCKAQSLQGESVHVPAGAVYVPWYFAGGSVEPPIFQPISTGLACHGSLDRARLGGLMEVVERDAFTLLWQTQSPLAEIAHDGLPEDSLEIIRRIHATGARVRLGLVPTDHGIPVCVATQTIDSDRMPAFSLAASASPDPADAVRKALEELVHTFRWMARLQASNPDFDPGDAAEHVVDQETHLLFWSDRSRRHLADFLFQGGRIAFADIPGPISTDPSRQLANAVHRIEQTGYRPLFVTLTTDDVAAFGFHVVRALVPGFNPLFMGHDLRSRCNPRLVARLAECEPDPAKATALNTLPHPFP
jgi:ribosomal protein S12 methylthiotransferase accessory factor